MNQLYVHHTGKPLEFIGTSFILLFVYIIENLLLESLYRKSHGPRHVVFSRGGKKLWTDWCCNYQEIEWYGRQRRGTKRKIIRNTKNLRVVLSFREWCVFWMKFNHSHNFPPFCCYCCCCWFELKVTTHPKSWMFRLVNPHKKFCKEFSLYQSEVVIGRF